METETKLPDLVAAFADAWQQRDEDPATRTAALRGPAREFRRLLVTGGAGFIGSAFVRSWLRSHPESTIVVLDKLTYAGNPENLAPCRSDPGQASRLELVVGDIANRRLVRRIVADCDAVLNFAAESHVDRSIRDAGAFLRTGVNGVHALLEAIRVADHPVRLLQVSTARSTVQSRRAAASKRTACSRGARTPQRRRPASCSSRRTLRPTVSTR